MKAFLSIFSLEEKNLSQITKVSSKIIQNKNQTSN